MRIIISQPRYLPAINYVNRLAKTDQFILLDTVQRQSRGWENRNKLLCQGNPKWLTIPIESSSRALIYDTVLKNGDWVDQHASTVIQYYKTAPYFDKSMVSAYFDPIRKTIESGNPGFSDIIISSISGLAEIFEFTPHVLKASSLDSERENWGVGPEELLRISKSANADLYISGPNGKEYGVDEVFEGSGVEVMYHFFDHPTYPQKDTEGFVPYLGFFDVLFNMGLEQAKQVVHGELKLSE